MIRKSIQVWFIILIFNTYAFAWVPATPTEAIFFEDADFKGASLTVRLQPGIRHRLLPDLGGLDKKISSIIVGDTVKVLAFTNKDFGGAVREYVYTIAANLPDEDRISSIILCPREEPPQGVLFIQKRLSEVKTLPQRSWNYITGQGIFFPLPEAETELQAKFPRLAGNWDGRARYVYVSPAVALDLFEGPEFSGRSLSLPSPDSGRQTVFDLSSLNLSDPKKSPPTGISSIVVKTRGSSKK